MRDDLQWLFVVMRMKNKFIVMFHTWMGVLNGIFIIKLVTGEFMTKFIIPIMIEKLTNITSISEGDRARGKSAYPWLYKKVDSIYGGEFNFRSYHFSFFFMTTYLSTLWEMLG